MREKVSLAVVAPAVAETVTLFDAVDFAPLLSVTVRLTV